MKTFTTTVGLLLGACALAAFSGCRAKPAPDSGFLNNPALMKADKANPFNRVYVNPTFRDKAFTEIYIAPVNTDYVMAQNIWEQATLADVSKDEIKKNVHMLAD